MQTRNDITYLLKKYQGQIAAWRTGLKISPWREIAAELGKLERESDCPGGEVLRQAWKRLQAKPVKQAKPVNAPASAVVQPFAHKEQAKPAEQAKPVNAAPAPVDAPFEVVSEHVQMQKIWEATQAEKKKSAFSSMYTD